MKFSDLTCKILLACISGFLMMRNPVYSQAKVQVVTKTIEKDLTCSNEGALRITAEKADIEIRGWDKKYMHIKVMLISKNADRQLAEDELEYLHFGINHEPSLVELTNSFIFPKKHKPVQGNLKAQYVIWIPRQYIISIINKFGTIVLHDLQTRTIIDAEYANMSFEKYGGYLSIKSLYSDVKADNINANMTCIGDHAELFIAATGGTYHFENQYGKIDLTTMKIVDRVYIKSTRTPVKITTNGFEQYSYDLSVSNAAILLPGKRIDAPKKSTGGRNNFKIKKEHCPDIDISTTFENIEIK